MKKKFNDYFLGVDVGTDSVGFAVTDLNYNLMKLNGKAIWGVRLFDSGNPAEERRLFRCARRRLERRTQRVKLLQELMAPEIHKVDPAFFHRLNESMYHLDDKTGDAISLNSLFYDKNYTDKDFHKEFPTIYHLRQALIEGRQPDVRLVYLALAHIVKHRGHFLFEGQKFDTTPSFELIFSEINSCLIDEFDFKFNDNDHDKLADILRKKSISLKKREISQLINNPSNQQKEILNLLVGGKVNLVKIFGEEIFESSDVKPEINFSDNGFEDKLPEIASVLQDKIYIIETLKRAYDWGVLADILQSEKYLSAAKVKVYEKHKKDLRILKQLVKKYLPKEKYTEIFCDLKLKDNYVAYVSVNKRNNKKEVVENGKCSQEDFNKYLRKQFENIQTEDDRFIAMKEDLELNSFMPKQTSKDNGVIPFQVHLSEMKIILNNAVKYLPFLNESDSDGITIQQKIEMIMKFRIPYYIGPLNDAHKEKGGNCWIVKKVNEKIRPWNFDDVVDTEKSAEQFIRRMTNKCTYLVGEDVVPKHSLLYSKYMVLNELNNLKINHELISVELKQRIFTDLFLVKSKVTNKALRDYLLSESICDKDMVISGIDGDFKANMSVYLDYKRIFNGRISESLFEQIILDVVLFGEDKKLLKQLLRKRLPDLTNDEEKSICALRYSGWGRFSDKFLNQLEGVNRDTGETFTTISALYNTNDNLMQLLSNRYTFIDEIQKQNDEMNDNNNAITYDNLVKDLYVSPVIKRSIWQTLEIVREIKKIMGGAPKKVFVEVAREEGVKKPTKSRQKKLIELYDKCIDDSREWRKEIEGRSEDAFKGDRLYLYYTQMGKCMYCGGAIEINDLSDQNMYDIDHIYPQSKVKDDSLNNRILVHRTCNAKKKDDYPLKADMRQPVLWKLLRDKDFISEIKYERLTRNTPLSNDELAGFIERQLVETRQSTKAVAEILNKIFENTEVVYVKAGNVSEFRKGIKCCPGDNSYSNEFIKVREINDYHHAKDAYLNIVVGNVYNTKFTRDPRNYMKNEQQKYPYNFERMYEFDVIRNGITAWKCGEDGTMSVVKKNMAKNNVLFTRYATEVKGGLFDQMIKKKGEGQIPIKGSDERLVNFEGKYGAYNKASGAYFFLVEHEDKKKTVRTIEYVPIYLLKIINNDKSLLTDYCRENLGLSNPKVLIHKIKKNTLFNVDGFLMHLSARQNSQLVFICAIQLHLPTEDEEYIKKIVLYKERCRKNNKNDELPQISSYSQLSVEGNKHLYNIMINKLQTSIYNSLLSKQLKTLNKQYDVFLFLPIEKQCLVLYEILHLFQCHSTPICDLSSIGGGGSVGVLVLSKDISKVKVIKIINQSSTGIFEKEIDLKKV